MTRIAYRRAALAPVLVLVGALASGAALAQPRPYSDDAVMAPNGAPQGGQPAYGEMSPAQGAPMAPAAQLAPQGDVAGVTDYTDDEVVSGGAGTTGQAASPAPGGGNMGGGSGGELAPAGDLVQAGGSGEDNGTAVSTGPTQTRRNALGNTMGSGRPVSVHPYIEFGQAFNASIKPAARASTDSFVAAGVDIQLNGNRNQASAAIRYERDFNETYHNNYGVLSGVVRGASAIVPGTLRLDYGGYANRVSISSSRAAGADGTVVNGTTSQVYSAFAGPTLTTHVGVAGLSAHYQAGYTDVGTPVAIAGSTRPVAAPDAFQHSFTQDAGVSLGTKAHELLPVGLEAEGGYHQDDESLLGQRVVDVHARGSVTVPITHSLAAVGGVGYEHTRVSAHNVQLDASGNPVVDGKGQYISDTTVPRQIAFDSSGLIWDAGIIWHPSPRTWVEAHYGRRYGSWAAWGTASWQPSARTSLNITVQDSLGGFGGSLSGALAGTPTQFVALTDPITGAVGNCVATLQSGGCLASVLGSVSAEVYRERAVYGVYGVDLGNVQTGIGLGYDRHEYLGAPGTILARVNGKADNYYWVAAYLSDRLDRQSTLFATIDAYRFHSGLDSTGDTTSIRATGTYRRDITRHLSASASVAVDGVDVSSVSDTWGAQGAVAMRYSF